MNKKFLFLIAVLTFISCATSNKTLKIYNENSLLTIPELFNTVFKEKDIVFLGESHRIKKQVEFISSMIPILQKQGIHILFTEFANYSDTKLTDSLLSSENYNEELAQQIIHNSSWDWAYKEYADIYKAAWKVNHNRFKGEKLFRIIGLQPDINYSVMQKSDDWEIAEKIQLFWNNKDNSWLNIIEKEAILKKSKAVVYCGLHHSFTKFHHPIVIDGKFVRFEQDREGTQFYNKYPTKTATIILYNHHPQKPYLFTNGVKPFNGLVDSIIGLLPANSRKFGFFTNQSALGYTTDTMSYYSMGCEKLVMKNFCDAFVVLGSVCDYETVTLIKNFINDKNLKKTIIQSFPYYFKKDWTVKECNDSIRKWLKEENIYLEKLKDCN